MCQFCLCFLLLATSVTVNATSLEKESTDISHGENWYYEDINGTIGYQESTCNDPEVYTKSFQGGTIDMYCAISTNTIVTEFAMNTGPNIPYQASVWTGGTESGTGGNFAYGSEKTIGTSIVVAEHEGGWNDHGVRGN
jgi:hypothetical protein